MRCGMCKRSGDDINIAHVRECKGVNPALDVKVLPRDRSRAPQWPGSEAQFNYVLGLQNERNLPDWWPVRAREDLVMMEKDEISDDINQLKTFTKKANARDVGYVPAMPAGRYALLVKGNFGAEPVWRFFEVQDGKGRWKGYKFLKRLIGAPGDYQKTPVGAAERNRIFRLIEENPDKAMTDYGLKSGVCGRCASPLSDPVSIARGIGPKCLAKLGW